MKTIDETTLWRSQVCRVPESIVNEMEENRMEADPKVGFVMRELYERINHPLSMINEEHMHTLYNIVADVYNKDFQENSQTEIYDAIVSDYVTFVQSNYVFYQNVSQWTDAYLDQLVVRHWMNVFKALKIMYKNLWQRLIHSYLVNND